MADNDKILKMKKRHKLRYIDLKNEYDAYWKNEHKDINDNIYYQRGRFTDEESYPNDGKRRDLKILNSTATIAHRTLTAGIYSGVTSPAMPWFRLTIDDPELKEVSSVKQYFDDVTKIILTDLAKSNFYTAAESLYAELGAFGISAIQIESHPDDVFRFTPFTVGQYYVDTDHNNIVDSVYRELPMRARNVVEMFGKDNVSETVKGKVTGERTGNEWVRLLHVQEFNSDRDVTKLDAANKPYISVYYELDASDDQEPLRVSGYDSKPFAVPRWSVTGAESYGIGPGSLAIGDVLMLQELEKDKLRAIKKQNSPPLVASGSAGDITINAGADGITWADNVTQGQNPILSPAYQVTTDIQKIQFLIEEAKERIRSVFYADLFFLIAQPRKGAETATEIIAKQNEKLALLGPIIERMQPEFLRPAIQRGFDIENSLGRLPEPPDEIVGKDIKIEIISLIAQAQGLAIVTPIQEVAATVSGLAERWPSVVDKFNADQAVDEIGAAQGIPAGIINSDEDVAKKRAADAELIDQQIQQENAQAAIAGAKQLSETDVSGDNALTAIAGGGAQ